MEMSIDRAASRRYRSYRRHRNMWFVILGVLLVLLLTFGCVFAVKRAAHKKGADASGSAHKTEQTGSTGAYENVELVTEGEKAKELEAQGKTEKEIAARTEPILGGAELTMLAGQTKAQMMSFLLETKKGGLIVVDGGWWDDARPGSPEDRHRAFQILAFEHAAHHGIPLSEGRAHNHAMRYRLRRRSLYCDHNSNPLAADEKTKRAANTPFAAPDQRLS